MSRFLFLLSLLSSTTSICAQRPDVLMILVDDLRPMLGCYHHPWVQTPNIDRLAAQSVVFERAYCQYAKCGTSRLSFLTGLRPDSIGVFSNREKDAERFWQRESSPSSLSEWMKKHGYQARSFGKVDHDGWHVDNQWSKPPSPGRDGEMLEIINPDAPAEPTIIADRINCPIIQSPEVRDTHLYGGRMTQQVINLLSDQNQQQPLFLAVGYRRPHLPFIAPQRYFDSYRPDSSWLVANQAPPKNAPILSWFNSDGYGGTARRVGLTMPLPPTREQAVLWNGYELRSYVGAPNHGEIDVETRLKLLHAYAACVSYVDAQIGKLLRTLESSGRRDNTIVLLFSDHGWHLGEHSAWGKMTNYEIATQVPLLISAPGISAGRTRRIAELVDGYPTLCEIIGVPAPEHLEGQRLTATLRNPDKTVNDVAHSQYSRYNGKFVGRTVRTDRFRYVQWSEKKTGNIIARELYDHQKDAMEMNNLASAPEFAKDIRRLAEVIQAGHQ